MSLYSDASQQSYSSFLCNERQENKKSCEKKCKTNNQFVNYIPMAIKNEILNACIDLMLSLLHRQTSRERKIKQTKEKKTQTKGGNKIGKQRWKKRKDISYNVIKTEAKNLILSPYSNCIKNLLMRLALLTIVREEVGSNSLKTSPQQSSCSFILTYLVSC